MMAQQFSEVLNRILKVPVTSALNNLEVPVEANSFLMWNSDATQIITVEEWEAGDPFPDHADHHENTGADEILVTGLSGLLADDQHVLDAEVLAYLLSLTGAAANLKSFINAAGTGMEWAKGIYYGKISFDQATQDSGAQAYTGVGFKPSFVIFFAASSGNVGETSIGFDNGINHNTIFNAHQNVSNSWLDAGDSASIYLCVTTAATKYTGYITTLGSDGFTITWTKTGSKTGTAYITYMAFR